MLFDENNICAFQMLLENITVIVMALFYYFLILSNRSSSWIVKNSVYENPKISCCLWVFLKRGVTKEISFYFDILIIVESNKKIIS